jgi:uncharacterized membrane protein (UPF0136 family)
MSSGSKFWQDDLGVAALLSATAGFADAVGYVNSGVFAANMTGNTVLAGLSLAEGKWDVALQRGMTLAAFCIGVVAASVVLRLARGRNAVPLVCEAVLVLVSAFAEAKANLSIALIATAMGMQAVAVTCDRGGDDHHGASCRVWPPLVHCKARRQGGRPEDRAIPARRHLGLLRPRRRGSVPRHADIDATALRPCRHARHRRLDPGAQAHASVTDRSAGRAGTHRRVCVSRLGHLHKALFGIANAFSESPCQARASAAWRPQL